MKFLLCLIVVMAAMGLCDAVWLGTMLKPLYQPQMGSLLSPTPNMAAAGAFYLLYALALTTLIVWPMLRAEGPLNGLGLVLRSALFGVAAYGTYDLTGLAVIRDWSLPLSLIDMGWGAVITAISAGIAALVMRRFVRR